MCILFIDTMSKRSGHTCVCVCVPFQLNVIMFRNRTQAAAAAIWLLYYTNRRKSCHTQACITQSMIVWLCVCKIYKRRRTQLCLCVSEICVDHIVFNKQLAHSHSLVYWCGMMFNFSIEIKKERQTDREKWRQAIKSHQP